MVILPGKSHVVVERAAKDLLLLLALFVPRKLMLVRRLTCIWYVSPRHPFVVLSLLKSRHLPGSSYPWLVVHVSHGVQILSLAVRFSVWSCVRISIVGFLKSSICFSVAHEPLARKLEGLRPRLRAADLRHELVHLRA